jgi:hypothetical protein
MTALSAVADGKLTNEDLGGLTRRFDEIKRRLNEGTLTLPLVMGGLQNIVEGCVSTPTFPVWKTLKLGTHKTPAAYRKVLKSAGRRVSDWVNEILNKVVVAPTEMDLDLVVCSVAELGFTNGARYDAICARGTELGLDLCPAEVGPALRLAYTDQPRGEWLVIAMDALTDSDGGGSIFRVEHDRDELWLYADCGNPDDVWYADHRFVFARRK